MQSPVFEDTTKTTACHNGFHGYDVSHRHTTSSSLPSAPWQKPLACPPAGRSDNFARKYLLEIAIIGTAGI